MKYIRRKDDVIFSTQAKIEDIDSNEYKQIADTIEELCDLFIIENSYCGQISQSKYYDFEVAKQNLNIDDNDVLYGALRIARKGLIYVAKMNSKGELELIWID